MKPNIFYHFKKATSVDQQTGKPNYKYYEDYIDTLDEEDIIQFLEDCGNPHKEEKDITLRMVWELSEINTARMDDKYFESYNH
tara:strand:+ start:163 stop:411 length:249 start_codon:yes stop_codon:yes gene_type:complete